MNVFNVAGSDSISTRENGAAREGNSEGSRE